MDLSSLLLRKRDSIERMKHNWILVMPANVTTVKLLETLLYRLQNVKTKVTILLVDVKFKVENSDVDRLYFSDDLIGYAYTDAILEKYVGKFNNIELIAIKPEKVHSNYNKTHNMIFINLPHKSLYESIKDSDPGCYQIYSGKKGLDINVTLGTKEKSGYFRGIESDALIPSGNDIEILLLTYAVNQIVSNNDLDFQRITWLDNTMVKTPLNEIKLTLFKKLKMKVTMVDEWELEDAFEKVELMDLKKLSYIDLKSKTLELLLLYKNFNNKRFNVNNTIKLNMTKLERNDMERFYSLLFNDIMGYFKN
jgi:hypothetical protein